MQYLVASYDIDYQVTNMYTASSQSIVVVGLVFHFDSSVGQVMLGRDKRRG